jgi:ABC-type uncharacterized transport system ATPase subunit
MSRPSPSTPTAAEAAGRPQALEAVSIAKVYGPTVACRDVSLRFEPGEVHALLGENGAGKTTLMRVLAGVTQPTAGVIRLGGTAVRFRTPREALRAGVGMVHQHFLLIPRMTVAENVALGFEGPGLVLKRGRLNAAVAEFSQRLGLPVQPARTAEDLSVGERQRAEIVRALYQGARFLILDEPTAVLTPQETASLFRVVRQLRDDGVTVVFISHKLGEARAVADRITVMRAGSVVGTFPPATTVRELGRAMVGRSLVPPAARAAEPATVELLRVRQLEVDGHPGLRQFDLALRAGEILGVAGVDGNGQAALEAVLSGSAVPRSGTIVIDGTPVTGYHPRAWRRRGVVRIPSERHRDGIIDTATIWENCLLFDVGERFSRMGLLRVKDAIAFARQIITAFDVRCSGPDQRAESLSGGNQQKLVVGRELSQRPRIVVACQPTRGLDVGAAAEVHRMLLEVRGGGGGVILISADLDEITALADRVCVMHAGQVAGTAAPADRDRIGRLMAGAGP